jgi:oxygen-dependent protoporphyrinogen oxidase
MAEHPPVVGEPAIVVGAGLAGLLAARRLARAGRSVRVLEAAARPGGQLAGIEIAGVRVDLGAEAFATRGGTVDGLLAELGLADRVVTPDSGPAWLVDRDGARELPATSLLGIPVHPLAADVVAVLGAAAAVRAAEDLVTPLVDPDRFESLGELVAVRMGEPVLHRLVAPVVRGVHSIDPTDLSVETAAPGLTDALRRAGSLAGAVALLRSSAPAGSAVASLTGGMIGLVDAIVAELGALGVRIETGVGVTALDRDGVLVGGRRIPGSVTVAAPALASAPSRRRRIGVVVLAVDAPELDGAPRGSGALVAAAPGVTARAMTHVSAKWAWVREALPSGRHLVRLSYDELPTDPSHTAVADLEAITGCGIVGLVDAVSTEWTRTIESAAADGVEVVGEAASHSGIAAIVADDRRRTENDRAGRATTGREGANR